MSSKPIKILLLEDDEMLGETLESLLNDEGYHVTWVRRGDDAIDKTYDESFDLYVFDIGVPDIDGIELLKALREADDQTPAIFATARTDLDSIAKAFDAGAYDYLKKPFYPEELLLHIRARTRTKDPCELIHCGEVGYDPHHKVLYRNDQMVQMGDVQRALAHLFMTRIGQVIEKGELYDVLQHPSDTALRVAINKLKQTTGLPIQNIRGVGYRLEAC
jgi:DNA-binding response OmpR family regulator